VNELKKELEARVEEIESEKTSTDVTTLDISAPATANAALPRVKYSDFGSRHPITRELEAMIDIFTRMGFEAEEARQIDDDWHMFGSLNFPEGHPARDGYDTFYTEEGFIPPAHTSTMEHRAFLKGREKLAKGEPIAHISYGRVFRNENTDATHEHTFYQLEGVFVSEKANLGQLLGTLKKFFSLYYGEDLAIKTWPAYFPFVEPGLELAIAKPKALGGKPGEWLELVGCGMTHPNVLKAAGIDPKKYTGFAWGMGIERVVMMKYGLPDVRLFESGKISFLREFKS
jgi:phenylalanyl-tRNA synthetase alpha chain